jgi:hypothetical protein
MIVNAINKKLEIEEHESSHEPWMIACALEGYAVPAPLVAPDMLLLNDTHMV